MTAVFIQTGVVDMWLVLLGLAVMAGATWLAWMRLETSRWPLALIAGFGMVPAAVAMWIGAVPSLHAGLTGTGLLVAANVIANRSKGTRTDAEWSDRLSALAIGTGFLALWLWDGLTLGIEPLLVVAPLAPVAAAMFLTLFQLAHHRPSAPVQSAKASAWALAAGAWFAMTLVGLLGPNASGLADPAGISGLAAYPVVLGVASAIIASLLVALPGMLRADFYPYQWLICPGYGGMQEVSFSGWSGFLSGYSRSCDERVADCSLWPTRKGCAEACARQCNRAD